MTDYPEVYLTPRGIGNNNLPCGWCSVNPAPRDLASFVASEVHGRVALAIFTSAGVTATLNTFRADEGRFQVKVGACDVHLPNLRYLQTLLAGAPLTLNNAEFTVPGVNE